MILRLVYITVATIIALGSPANSSAEELPLSMLVRETKIALLDVAKDGGLPGMQLEEVVLDVKTTTKVSVDGKVSFFVLTIGGEASGSVANNMVLSLVPPDKESGKDVAFEGLSKILSETILGSKNAIEIAMQGQPPLLPKRYEAEIIFAVSAEVGGGFEIRFPAIESNLDGQISNEALHSIKVVYSGAI